MENKEWERLDTLADISNRGGLSVRECEEYGALLKKTRDVHEHPDNFKGPCDCQACKRMWASAFREKY